MKKNDAEFSLNYILSRLMAERGVKAYDLAQGTGLPSTTISNILRGKSRYPRADTLGALAKFFGIEMEHLISGGGEAFEISSLAVKFSPNNTQQNKSSLSASVIPLIQWQEVKSWISGQAAVKAHTIWVPNSACKNPKSFALRLKASMYVHFFCSKMLRIVSDAILLVDLQSTLKDGSMVLVFLDKLGEPSLRLLTIDGSEKWLQPLEDGVPPLKLIIEHSIVGSVVEVRLNSEIK